MTDTVPETDTEELPVIEGVFVSLEVTVVVRLGEAVIVLVSDADEDGEAVKVSEAVVDMDTESEPEGDSVVVTDSVGVGDTGDGVLDGEAP